jgi:hypothetical protein
MNPRFRLCHGDLLDQPVEAIVNAWNRNFIPWWLLLEMSLPVASCGCKSPAIPPAPVKPSSNPARRIIQSILIVSCSGVLLMTIPLALCFFTPVSYLYCLAREGSWMKARSETELDARMGAFYTKHSINPKDSLWGRNYSLKPGERMVQYLIFGKEPLDVVFDRQSRVVIIFTSYE